MEKVLCQISRKDVEITHAYRCDSLSEGLYQFIRKDFPDLNRDNYISLVELNRYRRRYLTSIMVDETGELTSLERDVLDAIHKNKILSENIEPDIEEQLTAGQKVADIIARFGGSWTFIGLFFLLIFLWVAINVYVFVTRAFDPYPFILLNLILSCLAAVQAPVIMMSQNRVEQKDRLRGEHDYKVNLKAELEIRLLHDKLDHLIIHQNKRLLEIQEIQSDYLNDILSELKSMSKNDDEG